MFTAFFFYTAKGFPQLKLGLMLFNQNIFQNVFSFGYNKLTFGYIPLIKSLQLCFNKIVIQ